MESIVKTGTGVVNIILGSFFPPKEIETPVVIKEIIQDMNPAGRTFVRIAGASGAIAVMMSAYGAHAFNANAEDEQNLKNVFEVSNRIHLIHSAALLGVPLTRRPALVGGLMTAGVVLFSGTCYYHSLTGKTQLRKFTPYGGMLLILSWLCMLL